MQGFPLPRTAEIEIYSNGSTYALLRPIDTNLYETLHLHCPHCGCSLVCFMADQPVCYRCINNDLRSTAVGLETFKPLGGAR
jgi:hypothetical protein